MDTEGHATRKLLSGLILAFLLPAQLLGDYSSDVVLSQNSDLACGAGISSKAVMQIDLQSSLNDKTEAVAMVNRLVSDHGLESPVPTLIEQVYWDGRRRITCNSILRSAVRESASRGCDLVIILDMDVLEKVMIRPPYMDLKLPVSYVLVLFGSQVKNSARGSDN